MFDKLFRKKEVPPKKTMLEFNDGTNMDFDIFWLRRELEFQHQPERLQFRTNENHPLKFGELVNSLFDIRKEELAVLSINDGSLSLIEGADEIWNYEFLKHYNHNEKVDYEYYREGCSKLANQIVLTLSYKTYENSKADIDNSISKRDALLIVHLQYPEGRKNNVLYVQTTFCLPIIRLERSKKGINPQPQSLSILIGIDFRANEEIEAEFFKVFNSAKDKLNSEKLGALDYLERELLEGLFHPQISKEFYSGKMVMADNRFWDAIEYFNNTFKALQQKWWDEGLTDEEYKLLFECSFLIGYCYYELGLFDKASRYLEFSAKNRNQGYKYLSEYINNLIALNDIRSLVIIDQYLEELTKKREDDRTENDYDFFMFLLRRKAYCMIELKQFDSAEGILLHILKNDPENEFAKEEIEYIKQLRNSE